MCLDGAKCCHHNTPPLFFPSAPQQSMKFVAVGEVVVAIETDACCRPLLPPHPLLFTFHHELSARRTFHSSFL